MKSLKKIVRKETGGRQNGRRKSKLDRNAMIGEKAAGGSAQGPSSRGVRSALVQSICCRQSTGIADVLDVGCERQVFA